MVQALLMAPSPGTSWPGPGSLPILCGGCLGGSQPLEGRSPLPAAVCSPRSVRSPSAAHCPQHSPRPGHSCGRHAACISELHAAECPQISWHRGRVECLPLPLPKCPPPLPGCPPAPPPPPGSRSPRGCPLLDVALHTGLGHGKDAIGRNQGGWAARSSAVTPCVCSACRHPWLLGWEQMGPRAEPGPGLCVGPGPALLCSVVPCPHGEGDSRLTWAPPSGW